MLREAFTGWTVASRALNTVRLSMIPGAELSDMMVFSFRSGMSCWCGRVLERVLMLFSAIGGSDAMGHVRGT